MDLKELLKSPELIEINCDEKINEINFLLDKIESYRESIVDFKRFERESKLEAQKCLFDDTELLNFKIPTIDFVGYDKFCNEFNLENNSTFKHAPFMLYNKIDFFKQETYEAQDIVNILNLQKDKTIAIKMGLKIISLETNLDNIALIKNILINFECYISLVEIYATLIKILMNYGFDLELMEKHVIKFNNIKSNSILRKKQDKELKYYELDMQFSFYHVVETVFMLTNSKKIEDLEIISDYITLISLLYLEKNWQNNPMSMKALNKFLVILLKRVSSNKKELNCLTKAIFKIFQDEKDKIYNFIEFLPDNLPISKSLKYSLCKFIFKYFKLSLIPETDKLVSIINSLSSSNLNYIEINLVVQIIELVLSLKENIDKNKIGLAFKIFLDTYSFNNEDKNSFKLYQKIKKFISKYSSVKVNIKSLKVNDKRTKKSEQNDADSEEKEMKPTRRRKVLKMKN